ncbi:hypothetical protein D3C71_1674620 [compost metagenome]
MGWILANQPGSRPSRDSENQIRAAPSMKANNTLAMPITAENAIALAIHGRPSAANASDTGASPPRVE